MKAKISPHMISSRGGRGPKPECLENELILFQVDDGQNVYLDVTDSNDQVPLATKFWVVSIEFPEVLVLSFWQKVYNLFKGE